MVQFRFSYLSQFTCEKVVIYELLLIKMILLDCAACSDLTGICNGNCYYHTWREDYCALLHYMTD